MLTNFSGFNIIMTLTQWAVNEHYIAMQIKQRLPQEYDLEVMGSTDSTVSDLCIVNSEGETVTFVESKSVKSQCGQFVLTVNGEGIFEATSGLDNPHTMPLVKVLNDYIKAYPDDRKIVPERLTEEAEGLVYSWIKHHYTQMGVSFIAVTDNGNTFVNVIPLNSLEQEVNVSLNFPRIKQSGSSSLPKSHKELFKTVFTGSTAARYQHVLFEKGGKTFVKMVNRVLSLKEQYVGDEYFLSKVSETNKEALYTVRKRSKTRNVNEVLSFEYVGVFKNKGFDLLETFLTEG